MLTFAAIDFGLGIIGWIIVGLVAGWLANMANGGKNNNLIGSFVLGIVGAIVGGLLIGLFVDAQVGLIMSIVVAFIGALALTWIVRAVAGRNSPV